MKLPALFSNGLGQWLLSPGNCAGAGLHSLSQAMLDPSLELLQAPLFLWHNNRAHNSSFITPSNRNQDQWEVSKTPSATPGHWETEFKHKLKWKC